MAITLFKILFAGFKSGPGVLGFATHLGHEWVTLANLFGLLMGFALLSRHFEKSHVPVILPKYLPDDWKGAFVMLVMVFVLSSFLDNIAAALIGGAMAHQLFRAKVHIGYLAAIVAASNAGGAGSVVGDTTTTMMWIAGVSPVQVLDAYVAAAGALVIVGIPASIWQQRYSPILKDAARPHPRGLEAHLHRGADAGLRHRHERGAEPALRVRRRSLPVHRGGGVGGASPDREGEATTTGRCCPRPSRARSSCSRSSCAPR